MRTAVELALFGSVALTVMFLAQLGAPWRSEETATSWLLSAWGVVTLALELLILLALLRVPFPMWVALVVVLAQDGVWVWRMLHVRRARREDERSKV